MNQARKEKLRTTPLFGTADAKLVAEALGATFREEETVSKQGGGGIRYAHRWPGGARVDLHDLQTIEGVLSFLADRNSWVELVLRPRPKRAAAPIYYAKVGMQDETGEHRRAGEGEARTPVAALWLAVLDSADESKGV